MNNLIKNTSDCQKVFYFGVFLMNNFLMNVLTLKIRLKIAPIIEIDKSAAKKLRMNMFMNRVNICSENSCSWYVFYVRKAPLSYIAPTLKLKSHPC